MRTVYPQHPTIPNHQCQVRFRSVSKRGCKGDLYQAMLNVKTRELSSTEFALGVVHRLNGEKWTVYNPEMNPFSLDKLEPGSLVEVVTALVAGYTNRNGGENIIPVKQMPENLLERLTPAGSMRPKPEIGSYPVDLPYQPLPNVGELRVAFDRVARPAMLDGSGYLRPEAPGTGSGNLKPGEWYISRYDSSGSPIVVDSRGCTQAYHNNDTAEMACVAVNAMPVLLHHVDELESIITHLLNERQNYVDITEHPDVVKMVLERYGTPVLVGRSDPYAASPNLSPQESSPDA